MEENQPLVSVCMITYNHEDFIKQAIEGVLMQQTDFNVEFIISNDCSNDNTHVVIEKLIASNRNKNINFLYHNQSENLGMMSNFIFALEKCQGKYIALCEGDDYWIDSLKLQKQIDFLELNNEYSFCGHQHIISKDYILQDINIQLKVVEFEDLVHKNLISTASLVFRKRYLNPLFIKWLNKLPAGDWALQLFVLQKYEGYVLKDRMSVYRQHNSGVWSNLGKKEMGLKGIQTLLEVRQKLKKKDLKAKINNAIRNRKKEFGINYISFIKIYLKMKLKL